MFSYDREKNNKQVARAAKWIPVAILVWLLYEFFWGDQELAVFVFVVLVGFLILDKVVIYSRFIYRIRKSEEQKRFQWKLELIYLVYMVCVFALGFRLSDVFGSVI